MRTMNHVEMADENRLEKRFPWVVATCAFSLAVAALLIIYWVTAVSLVSAWARSGMYQYAFLIFPISIWLAWGKREELIASHQPSVSLAATPLLLGTGFIWLLGYIANVNLLQHIALITSFPILVLIFFGWSTVRMLMFPLAYLIFAVPAGHSLVGHFQTITALFSVKALQLTGVPVLLEAHQITTPSTVWKVAQACSGIKFFLACTALGCLFAYLMFVDIWRRIAFVIVSMIVPIIANGLRVYFTILIGENFGVQYASGTDHLVFGWQFFGTVLFLLFLGGWFIRQPVPPLTKPESYGRAGHNSWRYLSLALIGVLAVFLAAPVAAGLLKERAESGLGKLATTPPAGRAGWQGPMPAAVLWQPRFSGADQVLNARYKSTAGTVSLYTASYGGAPVTGHDLLAYDNALYDSHRWNRESRSTRKIALVDKSSLMMHRLVLRGALQNRMVWYWYRINGNTLASPVRVKAWQAWEQLAANPLTSSLIAVAVPFKDGHQQRATATLKRFVNVFYPEHKHVAASPMVRTP